MNREGVVVAVFERPKVPFFAKKTLISGIIETVISFFSNLKKFVTFVTFKESSIDNQINKSKKHVTRVRICNIL